MSLSPVSWHSAWEGSARSGQVVLVGQKGFCPPSLRTLVEVGGGRRREHVAGSGQTLAVCIGVPLQHSWSTAISSSQY